MLTKLVWGRINRYEVGVPALPTVVLPDMKLASDVKDHLPAADK